MLCVLLLVLEAEARLMRRLQTAGRKLLDKPPKRRSRFDRYPLYVLRYHQFIWQRYFRHYMQHVHDGRPRLPRRKCWSVRCWMQRNRFKRFWKRRAPIPFDGPNSPPFLHRRCRLPGAHTRRCNHEHLRHDYYWRMFMWVSRFGFPKPPKRKRVCVTAHCRHQQFRWRRYWRNYWRYTSLIPVIRQYDFNWRMWVYRYGGNPMRLQQIIGPALMAMGQHHGGMAMSGMMGGGQMASHMGMMGGGYGGTGHLLTHETKRGMLGVMQRDMTETGALAHMAQAALHRQQAALYALMHTPSYPSASAAQMHMQMMMQNMSRMQMLQQYRMQSMLQRQIWAMGNAMRGSCGCSICSHHPVTAYGSGQLSGMGGPAYYVRRHGLMSTVTPQQFMNAAAYGGHAHIPTYAHVRSPLELQMHVQALLLKNNVLG